MDTPNAILFDADGVFQNPPPDLAHQLASAMGVESTRAMEFILDLFRAEAEALTGAVDFFERVEVVFERWNLSHVSSIFEPLWHVIEIDQSVLSMISEIKAKGIFCGLVSNQQVHRARRMSIDLGYAALFDAEFYSCHVGHKKPSEDYFRAVIRLAGLNPDRTLFIDDRAENVQAARRVGLRGARFESEETGNDGEALRRLIARHGV